MASPKRADSQFRIKVGDDENEPEFHRSSTWRSDDYVRRSALKNAHGKSSFRYDEALPVENSRMTELLGVLGDIEVKKEEKKKIAKLEKGSSLLGDELHDVEQDAMLEVLNNTFTKRKKENGRRMSDEIRRTLQMVMDDDEDHDEDVVMNDSNDSSENDHDPKTVIDYTSPSPEVRDQLLKMSYSEREILAAAQAVVDKDDINAIVEHIENHRNSL